MRNLLPLLLLFLLSTINLSAQTILDDYLDFFDENQEGFERDFETYQRTLLAKAAPDECFFGIGDDDNDYNISGINCNDCLIEGGQPKVNQAYVWGMSLNDTHDKVFYSSAPNILCLAASQFFGASEGFSTVSYACEFGGEDWKLSHFYVYDTELEQNIELTSMVIPGDLAILGNVVGLRAVGSNDNIAIYAGPTFNNKITLFYFNPSNNAYLGYHTEDAFNNIRKFINYNGDLYAGVRNSNSMGGSVVKWTGNQSDPFEVVGDLDTEPAELEIHNGNMYVTTWPIIGGPSVNYAGLYKSPSVGAGLTNAHSGGWSKVWDVTNYEPDSVIAATYGGGALKSFDGELYWGTMHVPFLSTFAHFIYNKPTISSPEDFIINFLASFRAIKLFRGSDINSAGDVELLYGLPALPAYDKDSDSWSIVPNKMGGAEPTYGLSGFGNFFNNYTWAMEVYDDQLFVGTMDHTYLLFGGLFLNGDLPLPFDIMEMTEMGTASLPETDIIAEMQEMVITPFSFFGADLWRFPSGSEKAVPESFAGLGNYLSYGIRNMEANEEKMYLGMANPMNLDTDECGTAALNREGPIDGGWELIELALPSPIPTLSQWGLIIMFMVFSIVGYLSIMSLKRRMKQDFIRK